MALGTVKLLGEHSDWTFPLPIPNSVIYNCSAPTLVSDVIVRLGNGLQREGENRVLIMSQDQMLHIQVPSNSDITLCPVYYIPLELEVRL